MIRIQTLAATSLVTLAVLAAPAPALAVPYPPSGGASVVSVACTSTYTAEPGYFTQGETVTLEISADVPAAVDVLSTASYTAAADGSLVVDLPKASVLADQYELMTWGTASPLRGPILFAPTRECMGASAADESSTRTLSSTGTDLTPFWLSGALIGSGLLAIGAVALIRRRKA